VSALRWLARLARRLAGALRSLGAGMGGLEAPASVLGPDRPPLSNARWTGRRCLACGCKLYTDSLHVSAHFLCTACDARAAAAPPGPWASGRERERRARAHAAQVAEAGAAKAAAAPPGQEATP